jgi:hypothetical protein
MLAEKQVHEDAIQDMQLSPDGAYAITASLDKTAKLIDLEELTELKTYRTGRFVQSAAISPLFDHVLLGGGQDASQVTTTAAKAGGFEARFFHKVRGALPQAAILCSLLVCRYLPKLNRVSCQIRISFLPSATDCWAPSIPHAADLPGGVWPSQGPLWAYQQRGLPPQRAQVCVSARVRVLGQRILCAVRKSYGC